MALALAGTSFGISPELSGRSVWMEALGNWSKEWFASGAREGAEQEFLSWHPEDTVHDLTAQAAEWVAQLNSSSEWSSISIAAPCNFALRRRSVT